MPRIINFEGRRITVPDDATDDEVAEILSAQPGPEPVVRAPDAPPNATPVPAAAPAAAMPKRDSTGWKWAGDTAAVFARGARKGITALAGAPVDLVNNAPRLLGLDPISEKPVGGGQWLDEAAGGFGLVPEFEPEDLVQRIMGRVGYEVGANALPVAGTVAVGSRMGTQAARELARSPNVVKAITGNALEAAAVNPAGVAGRETAAALAAGGGAGVFNEAFGNPQQGDNFWSDFLGSAAGLGALGFTRATGGALGNLYSGATGTTRFTSDVVGEEVANRIINSSTQMGERAASGNPDWNDVTFLADQLRRPAEIEDVVPGYRANIADRTQDPGLATFAFNQDALSPGAANARRVGNEAAVDERIAGLDPGGDPAQFRAALEADRAARIAAAQLSVDEQRAIFGDAVQSTQPVLRGADARGSNFREALAERYEAEQGRVREAYAPINEANVNVDVAPLAERFGTVTDSLPLNTRQRFLPAEANVPDQLVTPGTPPTPSSILGPDGQPLMLPATPAQGEVPLNEVMSVRSGLTDDIRAANATPGGAQRAATAQQYRRETDEFLDEAIPPELREQYDAARATRRDVADRFERPGTAIAETLRTREGGGYAVDNSAVVNRFTPNDQGKVADFQAAMREVGNDPRARRAIEDELLSDIQASGLADRPDQLRRYLDERNVVLSQFPELRNRLGNLATSREGLTAAEREAANTERRLTTPGQSAQASYLKYGDEATVDAVRNLTSGPQPRESTRELLAAAGNTPEARRNARSALWEVVKTKKFSAPGITGGDRWDGKKLKAVFDDPKTSAVADELWSDNPAELDDIKRVFNALAGAEGSARARAVGSSGTAQALNGKFDPSLSASSIASRARSVHRGQLSPTIAAVDVVSTWLRGRSKQVQSRAIDTLASAAVNNPGLAADLLQKYNPADYAAKRRMISQKYGVRATQLLNLLDEANEPDGDLKETINGR